MILSFDKFERYELPQVTLCNPNSRAIEVDGKITITDTVGVLSNSKGMNLKLNFNAPHELSFDYYRHKSSDPIKQSFYDSIYEAIQTDRYVYLTDIGYFIISNVSDSDEDNIDKKSISLKSCEENELAVAEGLHLKEGTYYLHTDNNDGLLDLFLPKTAGWTMGYIDPSLLTKPYYVEDTEVDNGYNFLYTTVQNMFECIVEPDIIKRTISVYSRVYYAEHHLTDIHIAKYNLLKHRIIEESDEDKYTALNVQGKDENLEIRAVNPTGKNVIYNFEPRYSWMSSALQQAIEKWQEKCESVEDEYLALQKGYYAELETLFNEEQNIEVLTGELKTLEETRDAVIITVGDQQSTALNNVNAQIAAKQAEINTVTLNYNSHKNTVKANYEVPINQINSDCALDLTAKDINGNIIFAADLLNELMTHIKPTEYVDEYMLVTESMTYPQRFEKAKELMDRAKSQLVKISSGQKTYSVDTRSFLFNKHFKHFSEQLCAGAIIYVETKKDIMEQLHLTGIDINFDDKSTSFTLGNKYDRSDLKALYDEALGQNSKSFNELKYIASIIEDQQKQLDYQRNWVADLRTLTLDNVLTSEDQAIEINNRGLIGRKRQLNEDGSWKEDKNGNPLFELEQVKLINNTLVFTKDNWNSASTAVGKIAVGYNPDGSVKYSYGINGQVLIGELILGNNLVLTGTGAGIKIKDSNGNNAFYADENGNLVLSGKIFANAGSIAGWKLSRFRRVLFIGDSYGVGASEHDGTVEGGWPVKLANFLEIDNSNYANCSESGSGFINGMFFASLEKAHNYAGGDSSDFGSTFTDIVIAGGYNDQIDWSQYNETQHKEKIQQGIKVFNERAKLWFPNAKITLLGISWCNDSLAFASTVKTKLKTLYENSDLYPFCKTLGWDYVDAHDWSSSSSDFTSDNYHPNETGLFKIANTMAEHLKDTIGRGRLYNNPQGYDSDSCGFYLSNVPSDIWAIEIGKKDNDYSSVGGDTGPYRSFLVSQQGTLWASDAHIKGKIVSTSGTIGGWDIGRTSLINNQTQFQVILNAPTSYGGMGTGGACDVFVIEDKTNGTYPFVITSNGNLHATKATITGTITATSGAIAGMQLSNGAIYNVIGWNEANNSYCGYSCGLSSAFDNSKGRDIFLWVGAHRTSTNNYTAKEFNDLWLREIANDDWTEGSAWEYTTTQSNIKDTASFYVTWDGVLHAKNANISGNIIATSGSFKGTVEANTGNIGTWNIFSDFIQAKISSSEAVQLASTGVWTNQGGDPESVSWHDIVFGIYNLSDERVKKDITDLNSSHDIFFDALRPKEFRYNNRLKSGSVEKLHLGYIYQNVLEAKDTSGIGEISLAWEEDGYGKINKNEFIALNTWQIQKLKKRASAAETRIMNLEATVAELKSQLQTLTAG